MTCGTPSPGWSYTTGPKTDARTKFLLDAGWTIEGPFYRDPGDKKRTYLAKRGKIGPFKPAMAAEVQRAIDRARGPTKPKPAPQPFPCPETARAILEAVDGILLVTEDPNAIYVLGRVTAAIAELERDA